MKTNVVIALTSAVVIEGEIRKKGDEVEVSHALAQDLLRRGRGTLVEGDDEGQEVDLATLTKAQLVEFALHEYELELDASFKLLLKLSKAYAKLGKPRCFFAIRYCGWFWLHSNIAIYRWVGTFNQRYF